MTPISDRKERRNSDEEKKAIRKGMEKDQTGNVSTPVLTEEDAVGAKVKRGYYLDSARRQKARINAAKKGGDRAKNGGRGKGSNDVAGMREEGKGAEDNDPENTPLPETSQSLQDSSREGNNSYVSEGIAIL